ncbi:MAG: diguanylate cyclase [Nitrospirae bacterium]|nr:MAG: diguanylate cyclase [Nitrospirota bacterium]
MPHPQRARTATTRMTNAAQELLSQLQAFQQFAEDLPASLANLSGEDCQAVLAQLSHLYSSLSQLSAKLLTTSQAHHARLLSPNLFFLSTRLPGRASYQERACDGHLITDQHGCIYLADGRAAQLVGMEQSQLTGMRLHEFVHPGDHQHLKQVLRQFARGQTAHEWNLTVCPKQRPAFPASLTASALREPAGHVTAIHWLIRDITEEQRAHVANELFRHLGEQLLEGREIQGLFTQICEQLNHLFGYPLVWITHQEDDGALTILAAAGHQAPLLLNSSPDWHAETGNPLNHVLATQTPYIVQRDDPAWKPWVAQTLALGWQSMLMVPLKTHKQVLGVLTVSAPHREAFNDGVIAWFERLAAQLSLTLSLAKDRERLRLQEAVLASAEHAILITDPFGRIEWINDAYTRLTGHTAAEAIGRVPPFLKSGKVRSILRQARRHQTKGQAWRHEFVEKRKDGQTIFVEQVLTPLRNETGEVTHFVAIHQDITARKETEARIFYLAHYDPVTDLPNRTMFHDRLKQALAHARRHGLNVAVVFLDLDRFKPINDSLGHEQGDVLLKIVAERLRRCVRETDTVARWSGDEFVLILQDLERGQDAGHVARKVLEAVAHPMELAGTSISTTASLGIALYPLDTTDPQSLLTHADRAMYRAKEKGGNCYQFVSDELNAQVFERLLLQRSLHHAWNRQEFLLHFQPLVNLHTGMLIGIEALIRWQHPELGLIFPQQFIPLAQEHHLLMTIQEWVLRAACLQNLQWQAQGLFQAPLTVNLLVDPGQEDAYSTVIRQVLADTHIAPQAIKLEIPASTFMNRRVSMESWGATLASLGLELIIDDCECQEFPAGLLEPLPLHSLKLASTIVSQLPHNPEAVTGFRTCLDLSHRLQRPLIAKGVESPEQVAFLRSQGCHHVQGYLCSRPLSADEMTILLRGWWGSEF